VSDFHRVSSVSALLLGIPLLVGCPDQGVTVHNAAPNAEITNHSDGDQPDAGYRMFTGAVEDPDHDAEDLELTWLYDGTEACPPVSPDESGNTSCEIFLDSGDCTITLQVEDPMGGIGTDKVTLDVQPYGEPSAQIDEPVRGGVYYAAELIEFSGSVQDESDDPADLVVAWESSVDGPLDLDTQPDASGSYVDHTELSEGPHAITMLVTNTGGNQASDSVTIEVYAENTPPTCSIDQPANYSEYEYGERVDFVAAVGDENVSPAMLSASWSSNRDGSLGDSTTPGDDGQVLLSWTDFSVGAHTVSLLVEDEGGLTTACQIVVEVLECPTIWHADDDGDGFGDPYSTATGCEVPSGYVDDDQDCDDDDASVHPDATEICNPTGPSIDDDCDGDIDDDDATLDTSTADTWYADSDGDSYGDSGSTTVACDQPTGYLADATDCDDADATAYPGAPELCDGADDDCDGTVDEDDAIDASTWYADADSDGYGDSGAASVACSAPSGHVADSSDCDDVDGGVNPGASEFCDGVDNDCNGTVDEDDASDAVTWYQDADADGFGSSTSTTAACSVPSGYVADSTDCDDSRSSVNPDEDETCNSRDDDCDGDTDEDSAIDASTWYQDRDSDGYGDDATTTLSCSQPTGYVAYGEDCDDGNAAYNPGATEADCSDPADYNCDGSTAYADADGDGFAACEECDDTDAAIFPGTDEHCDGVDNDCDGDVDEHSATDAATWYADADADGYGDVGSSAVACNAPSGSVADATDCDDADTSAFPGAPEYCDAVDNDCDGTIDEDDALDASTWYLDADSDGYGDATATQQACSTPSGYVSYSTDCDDGDGSANPGAIERCDGVDNDCDGDVDEADAVDVTTWHLDADGDGYGGSLYEVEVCDQPSGFVADDTDCSDSSATIYPGAAEYCNGSDDDCDGTTDDDDAVDATTWYLDADSDGYGGSLYDVVACDQPTGFVADTTDCSDVDASIHPGADERCNGDDDDCDGATDEDDAVDVTTWYLDGDGDGYGVDTDTSAACEQPSGYAAYAGDCNDSDTAYNPGTVEDDCTDPNDYNCDGSTGYTDDDADGWAACEDCDDLDASIFPGADEECDGADNDCDGTVDEDDAVDAIVWYADSDGDGYGDSIAATVNCTAPTGHVAVGTDCDDGSITTYPGAPEFCDGHDDDCDGAVDEDEAIDASTWYADIDADGFGDGSATQTACSTPSGYTADATDCDDFDATINPDAADDCNGVDDDCDGILDDDCCPTGMLPIPTSSSSFSSGWFCIDDALRWAEYPSSATIECASLSDVTASVCTVDWIQEAYVYGYDWGQDRIGTDDLQGDCCCPCGGVSGTECLMWYETGGSVCECWGPTHIEEFLCCGEP